MYVFFEATSARPPGSITSLVKPSLAIGRDVGGKRGKARIGQFGVGFCSSYHLTDVPCILSGERLQMLDPHVRNLQAAGAELSKPGVRLNFMKSNLVEKFPDQFEPYKRILKDLDHKLDANLNFASEVHTVSTAFPLTRTS